MQIESVRLALPSRKATNDDVIEIIREHSASTFQGDLEQALDQVRTLLRYTGANTRYFLGPEETPIGHLCRAAQEALDEARCVPDDIELLIYVGVGRGFAEPGNSYFVAQALGMKRTQCFDILDACNSWSRALHLVHCLIAAGVIRRAMIVNAEFNCSLTDGVGVLALRNMEQLEWTIPGYTVGEAATATIVARDPDREWNFQFSSRTDLADLCTIPMPNFKGYCRPSDRVGRNGQLRFTSYGVELFNSARPELVAIWQRLDPPIDRIRAVFPHAASHREALDIAKTLGLRGLMWGVYPRCGNVVSASVPAAIAIARDEGRIKRGDFVVGLVASAGMAFAAYSFIY